MKESGLGMSVFQVADASSSLQDLRNDFTNYTVSTPRAEQDVTGLNESAHERILLLADAAVEVDMVFNPASNKSHAVFSTVPSTSVARAVNTTVNGASLNFTGILFTDYNVTRSATGELLAKAPGVLADGAVPTWS